MIKSIHAREHHFGWDNSIQPKVIVSSGTSIEIQTLDSSATQLNKDSTVADLMALDFARVNPVTGPIFIEGAEPGDAIKVTFEEFKPSGWGWTANIPGFGLLADQFTEPAIHIWKYDANNPTTSDFHSGGSVPLKPFVGTIGLALAEAGLHSVVPPRRVGGNLDIRDMSKGTELMLPVEVIGGLLSMGDTHAAQGDGEVCGYTLKGLKRKDIPFLRRKIGIVFQDFQLLTDRNVLDNLKFVLGATGWKDKKLIEQRALNCLQLVGIEQKANAFPHMLSGGEQQRVSIARALLNQPALILADEPTGNLDAETAHVVADLILRLHTQQHTMLLVVTHSETLGARFERRWSMNRGVLTV